MKAAPTPENRRSPHRAGGDLPHGPSFWVAQSVKLDRTAGLGVIIWAAAEGYQVGGRPEGTSVACYALASSPSSSPRSSS